MLVNAFLENLSKHSSGPEKNLSKEAMDLLGKYHWQGNVRELKNLVERLSIMVQGETIEKEDIPQPYNPEFTEEKEPERRWLFTLDNLEESRIAFEQEFLRSKVEQENGDLKAAAKKIGTTVRYIKKRIS